MTQPHHNNTQEVTTPDNDERPASLEATNPDIEEHIQRLAASAPDMTDDQCARLARLLGFR